MEFKAFMEFNYDTVATGQHQLSAP
jgi:hypothetical protein